MTRSNLAVCFSPVLFHLNIEQKKKKLYHRHRNRQQQQQQHQTLDANNDDTIASSTNNLSNNEADKIVITIDEPSTSSALPQTSEQATNIKKSLMPLEVYKRKCSKTLNKAATSIANFSAGIVDINTQSGASYSYVGNIEDLSKVGQLCVGDMIKYSMDLFTVSCNRRRLAFGMKLNIKILLRYQLKILKN
jgi:hypothetical protein